MVKGSKLKLAKKTVALILGVVLAFSQEGLNVLAEQNEGYGTVETEVSSEEISEDCDASEDVEESEGEESEFKESESSESEAEETENSESEAEETESSESEGEEDVTEAFEMEQTCADVTVCMSAPEGVFPKGAYFEVREVNNYEEENIDKAISEISDSNEQVAASYTYDITVYDKDGNEIEPNTDYGQVSVTFSLKEAEDDTLQAKVYHIEGSGDELSAEELETTVSGDEVTVLTDGFSVYTLKFIYEDVLKYTYTVAPESNCVSLFEILDKCGINYSDGVDNVNIDRTDLLEFQPFDGGDGDGWIIINSDEPFSGEVILTVSVFDKEIPVEHIIKITCETGTDILGKYLDWDNETSKYVERNIPEDSIEITTAPQTLESNKFYVVKSSKVLDGRMAVNGTAHLILCNGTDLTVKQGIDVSSGSTLYIYAQSTDKDKMGTLVAYGQDNNAGIGGTNGNGGGYIIIVGGKITAIGGTKAAGIGGGNEGAGGRIEIFGGEVTATGGGFAAGIGGGYEGAAGDIVINTGCTVTAEGGTLAAGIGSGQNDGSGNGSITINGGTISAKGGAHAAGIGGGKETVNCTITIKGGTIKKAEGGAHAAGIGSGYYANTSCTVTPKNIVIDGGIIEEARGGDGGAGIGNSDNTNGGMTGGAITISGGEIHAFGGNDAAGIGGGNNGTVENIKIENGKIEAKGGNGATGIGNGKGNTGNVNIEIDPKYGITAEELKKRGEFSTFEKKDKPSDQPKRTNESSENESSDEESSVVNNGTIPLLRFSLKNVGSQKNGGKEISGICTFEKQGPLCAALFKTVTPKGFEEAFSFNLNLDATGRTAPNYGRKVGQFVLNIPKQYRKAGRVFALIGVGRNGKVKFFYDSDMDDETFTTNLDIEGYAFSFIYSR